jgi:hypothetical protein
MAVDEMSSSYRSQRSAEVVKQASIGVNPTDLHVPAADTAAQQVLAADSGKCHVIGGVAWSYSAAPTGGKLTILDGTDKVFEIEITAAGPGFIPFPFPKRGTLGRSMTVTLAAGGGGVTGIVNLLGHWKE